MLEIHVDAPEEHAMVADVVFVDANRRVSGNQANLAAMIMKRTRPRVVVHARPTEHASAACCDDCDMHDGGMNNDQAPMTNEVCCSRFLYWSLELGHWSFHFQTYSLMNVVNSVVASGDGRNV